MYSQGIGDVMKTKLLLLVGMAAILTSCGYSETYDELEYLTGPDESCTDKCSESQFCINAVCMPKMDGGEECYGDHQCKSGLCSGLDRDNGKYFGKCHSYGGAVCKTDSDCIHGTCNDGICACSDHNGCDGSSVCDAGTCLPIVECPSNLSAKCILIHDVVPNLSWANGSGVAETSDDPYFGNMINFNLPPKYAYSCGVMGLYIIGDYLKLLGSGSETSITNISAQLESDEVSIETISESIRLEINKISTVLGRMTYIENLLDQLDTRLVPSCISMELPTANENEKITYLEYKFTPNKYIKDIATHNDSEYNLYFASTLADSNIMGSQLFQMTLGMCDEYEKTKDESGKDIDNKDNCIKMKSGASTINFPLSSIKTISSRMSYINDNFYRVYFKGGSGAELKIDDALSLFCNNDYTYIKNDEVEMIPMVGDNAAGCKTVKFLMPSLKVYVEIDIDALNEIKKVDSAENNTSSNADN